MKEKNVSNEQLSNILLNSRRSLHRKQAYQKLAEKILFRQAYTFDDFCFVNEKSKFSIANFSKSPEMVFAALKPLLEALQEQICIATNEEAIKNFLGFVDKIQDADLKFSPLLYCGINAKHQTLREQSLFRLMMLPKLSSENEYCLLEQSIKYSFLCRELYPERLSFLNPERNYGSILKKLHIGDHNQDRIGVWIVVNSGSFCPNEMLKYLSLRSEMCVSQTPETEEIAIRSFANFRYKFYSNFDTELLRKFIKSRNLSIQTDIKILDMICRHIQDQALLEEYGRLSLMCDIETINNTLDIFKRHGTKWPESQIAFYTAVIKRFGSDATYGIVYTYIYFTIKNMSLYQKEGLIQSPTLENMLNALVSLPNVHENTISEIIDEIVSSPILLSGNILQILLAHYFEQLQTGLNRYKSVSDLVKILETLLSLPKLSNPDQTNQLIVHIVKNILILDSKLNDELAEIICQSGLSDLTGLPGSIKQSLAEIENEEHKFQEFMKQFA